MLGDNLPVFTAGDEAEASVMNTALRNARDGSIEITVGEAIDSSSLPIPVCLIGGEIYKCDANDTTRLSFIGFLTKGQNLSAGELGEITLNEGSPVKGFSGLTKGSKYYISDTIGTISTTPGTYYILAGIAVSTTEILILKQKRCNTVIATHDMSATGAETTAHNLGVTPRRVKITAMSNSTLGKGGLSIGTYYNGATKTIYKSYSTTQVAANDTTNIAHLLVDEDGGNPDIKAYATIGVDATNITLTWSKSSTPTGTAYLLIEVFED